MMLLALLLAAAAAPVSFREYDVPTPKARPHDPAVAPDGALWVTEQLANKLGRLDPATGQFREFPLTTPGSGPHGLVADKAGHIWFTAIFKGYVGELDPQSGRVREYPVKHAGRSDPHTPVFDQQGILWFTAEQGNFVGRLDPRSGKIDVRDVPTPHAVPYGIVVAPDGTPWFCEFGTSKLGSIDPKTLVITEFSLPEGARPRRLAVASDGVLWYGDFARGYLGRYDPRTFAMQEWRSPGGPNSQPYGIAVDRDDVVWYSESGVEPNTLVRYDPAHPGFSSTPIPSGGGVVRNMVAAPDGRLYLAESGVNKVAIATPSPHKLAPVQRATPHE
jgi:virginiamycin B lyase